MKIKTICDHPLAIGEILRRAQIADNRKFARRHRARRLALAIFLLEIAVYGLAVAGSMFLIWRAGR
jgi:hypothetical protein